MKNPITLDVLEAMDAIDRRGSYAKAAEELNKATSALSYTIQKLEEQLDIPLFQRQGRRSVLTPAGRLILLEGRDILNRTARLANAAKEVATGWETRIRIAADSLFPYDLLFCVLRDFIEQHPTIELDVQESVLNGGWELLDEGEVDLVVGVPGPVPRHKGYRSSQLSASKLLPVISAKHASSALARDQEKMTELLPSLTRVITHDSSRRGIKRSEGLSSGGKHFYVQNTDQKLHAILSGIGVGHLPSERIQRYLESGELIALNIDSTSPNESFMVWKLDNKGNGLRELTDRLAKVSR